MQEKLKQLEGEKKEAYRRRLEQIKAEREKKEEEQAAIRMEEIRLEEEERYFPPPRSPHFPFPLRFSIF